MSDQGEVGDGLVLGEHSFDSAILALVSQIMDQRIDVFVVEVDEENEQSMSGGFHFLTSIRRHACGRDGMQVHAAGQG